MNIREEDGAKMNPVERDGKMAYRIGHYRVRLVRDSSVPSEVRTVRTSADVAAIARTMLEGADREHFIVLLLNTRHGVIGVNTVSVGGLASAPVHPREVFKPAIVAGAAAVILAHNHPSGDPEPSRDDLAVTVQIRAAGALLGIEVLDHIIVGEHGYVSLRESRQGGF